MMQPNAGGIAAISPQATQQPMPGQTNPQAIQGVLQQGQGAGPPPQGGRGGIGMPLSQVPIEVLYAAAQGQSQDILPYQAISELQDRIKKQKMQQAMQGQQAMAAAAQQAQKPPVAQEILEEGRQLAKLDEGIGGMPLRLADGGIVAFSKGGSTQEEQDRQKLGEVLDAVKNQGLLPAGAVIADLALLVPRGLLGAYNSTVIRGLRAAGVPIPYVPGDYSSTTPYYDEYVRKPEAQTSPISSGRGTFVGRGAGDDITHYPAPAVQPPPAQRPPAGTGSARESARVSASARVPGAAPGMSATELKPPSAQDIYGGVNKELERTIGELGLRKNISPEEQRLRDILARQSQENIEAQRADIATGRKEAEEARAKGTTQPSLFDDAEGLFALAGSIDTRKGKVFGSASKGMSGILRERRLSREAAEKDYKQYLREERAANTALRQIEMLETQRQLAVQSGDRQRVEAIDDKINVLKAQAEQNRVNAGNTAFGHQLAVRKNEIDEFQAQSGRMQAEAAKTSASAQVARAAAAGAGGGGKPLTDQQKATIWKNARDAALKEILKDTPDFNMQLMSPKTQANAVQRLNEMTTTLYNQTLAGIQTQGQGQVVLDFTKDIPLPRATK